MGQRKSFYRQRIPESRKETVNIDILVTSRYGDRKIIQSIGIMSRPPSKKKEVEPVETVLKNIYQRNTYTRLKTGQILTMSQGFMRSNK